MISQPSGAIPIYVCIYISACLPSTRPALSWSKCSFTLSSRWLACCDYSGCGWVVYSTLIWWVWRFARSGLCPSAQIHGMIIIIKTWHHQASQTCWPHGQFVAISLLPRTEMQRSTPLQTLSLSLSIYIIWYWPRKKANDHDEAGKKIHRVVIISY